MDKVLVKQLEGDALYCEVERLNSAERTDPKWEVLPPDGYHFLQDGYEPLHGLIAYNAVDMRARAAAAKLTVCNRETCQYCD